MRELDIIPTEEQNRRKMPAHNERFGVMAAEARRNGSANLEVCTPQEVQWKPPLRQAATTLGASGGHSGGYLTKHQEVSSEHLTQHQSCKF